MINKNDVTIIIPSLGTKRNNYARGECLDSLIESGFSPENIIVAFNNIDEDSEAPSFLTKLAKIKVIALTEQGQCKATNAAVATVNTEWIMVTNDDMIFPPDWFERLAFTTDGNYTISPILIEPNDGAVTFKKYFCGGAGGDFNKQKFMEYAKNYENNRVRPGFNLPFLMKKEVWDLVGGYDVNYDPWGSNSDSDLEYKLKLAGVEMWQNTNCPVYHFSQTSGTFHPSNRSYWAKNFQYFKDKWGFERIGSPEIWTTEFEIDYDKLKYKPSWAKLPQEEGL